MAFHRKTSAVALRTAERKDREAAAPRLTTEVPKLVTLDIQFVEQASEAAQPVTYMRRVVVAAAPALFEVGCGDSSCKGGGHDLTHSILRDLKDSREAFTGEDACYGSVGTAPCRRVLKHIATATYR